MTDESKRLDCPLCYDDDEQRGPGIVSCARFTWVSDGRRHDEFDYEEALAFLFAKGTLFMSGRSYGKEEPVFELCVNCNDLFAWACADAEPISPKELPVLYDMVWDDPTWGSSKWCCKKRNQRPQPPVEKRMRAAGAWDELMEALPSNTMDAETQALFAQAAAAQNRNGAA